MEFYCTPGSGIEMISGYDWNEELFGETVTPVTPAMMLHHFPILLSENTDQL